MIPLCLIGPDKLGHVKCSVLCRLYFVCVQQHDGCSFIPNDFTGPWFSCVLLFYDNEPSAETSRPLGADVTLIPSLRSNHNPLLTFM